MVQEDAFPPTIQSKKAERHLLKAFKLLLFIQQFSNSFNIQPPIQ